MFPTLPLFMYYVFKCIAGFLMTMKHKHHLQMMNMKRAKKKAELKSAKLQTLLSEIRVSNYPDNY